MIVSNEKFDCLPGNLGLYLQTVRNIYLAPVIDRIVSSEPPLFRADILSVGAKQPLTEESKVAARSTQLPYAWTMHSRRLGRNRTAKSHSRHSS